MADGALAVEMICLLIAFSMLKFVARRQAKVR